jgi:outer membrane receptor for ferrienterochelin and colicins
MNKILPFSLIILLFLVLVHVTAASDSASVAAIKDDSIENLDDIIVTASRTKRIVSETPASVSVITKNTIASSAAKTIEDLLLTQTGVQVKRSVFLGEGIPSDIIIRGIPGSLLSPRTLILVDGIPTNASGTPFLIVNEVPMEAIERIEIVRGPYSSLYGANAFGGVINIITREGYGKVRGSVNGQTSYPFNILQQYYSEKKSMATSLKKAGPLALWSINGTGSGGNEDLSYLASMGYRTIGNYLLRNYAIARDGSNYYRKKADNYDCSDVRIFSKLKFFPTNNSTISLHMRYFNSDLGFGKTKNIFPDSMDVNTKGEKILVGPRAEIIFSKYFTLRAGGFYRFVTGEFWSEEDTASEKGRPTYWKSRTSDWQAEAQGFLSLGKGGTLTIGADFLRNSGNFGAFEDPTTGIALPHSHSTKKAIVNGAGYVQDELKLFDRLNVVPVVRLDYHSQFGSAFSPKLGISYKIMEMVRFHSSAGRSFRAPSLAELYLPDFPVTPGIKLKPNPDLQPEYIWGFDGGFDVMPINKCVVKINAFYNLMDNLINQTIVSNPNTGIFITHRNISAAWSQGIELECEWRFLQWLSLAAHGTIQDSRDKTYKVTLDYVPRYMFGSTIGLAGVIGSMKMDGQIGFNYIGKRNYLDFQHTDSTTQIISTLEGLKYVPPSRRLPSYYTLDLSYRIFLLQRLWLNLTVQNLLNAEYEEAPGNLAPGIFPSLKIGYDF